MMKVSIFVNRREQKCKLFDVRYNTLYTNIERDKERLYGLYGRKE